MFKKFLFLFLLILVFSFAFADKFVITENNISTKSVSVENNVENNFKNKPELLDISKIKIISDNDFEKKNKSKIKTISETLDTNHIELFQSYSVPTVYADYGWNLDVTGNNVRIGIVDTGLDSSGTAVLGKDVVGRNFCSDYESSHYNCDYIHGCLVASIAGGNASDLNGIAKGSDFAIARIFNSSGTWCAGSNYDTFFSWIIDNESNIINNSWGCSSVDYPDDCPPDGETADAKNLDIYDLSYLDNGKDVLFVFSAGNDGYSQDSTISNQCSAYNVLCVAGTYDHDTINRADDTLYVNTSIGPTSDNRKKPDITAPGQSILSYRNGSSKSTWSGTSASSPHVSGAAALLEEIGIVGLNAKALLINSADDIYSEGWDKYTGWGYLNIQNALDWNAYLSNTYINDSILIETSNLQESYIYPIYANYYDLNNEDIKCTLAWRRYFDNQGNTYLQNFDLFLQGSDSNAESISEIDNVEQVVLDNANNSYLKVYCADNDYSSDINYALSCNTNINQVALDYYVKLNDDNFYYSL